MDEVGFRTQRLRAREWHAAERAGSVVDLPTVVAEMLTEPVTRWLPPDWHGAYTRARAREWIAERDAEGPVLLVEDRESGAPVGLVLLFEEARADGGGVDVRLGYLLGESAWGRGLGGELLGGFVEWCRTRPEASSIIGGVAPENSASIRLLERHGFVRDPEPGTGGDLIYRLAVAR